MPHRAAFLQFSIARCTCLATLLRKSGAEGLKQDNWGYCSSRTERVLTRFRCLNIRCLQGNFWVEGLRHLFLNAEPPCPKSDPLDTDDSEQIQWFPKVRKFSLQSTSPVTPLAGLADSLDCCLRCLHGHDCRSRMTNQRINQGRLFDPGAPPFVPSFVTECAAKWTKLKENLAFTV